MKDQLQYFIKHSQMTQNQVAKALGKSTGTISQYLRGEYKGNTEEIDDAVRRLIARHNANVVDRKFNSDFVMTYAAKRCIGAIQTAHNEHEVSVIYGAAGLGKTQALKQYVRENPETVFIEVDPGYNAKVLLKALCKQLGQPEQGANHDLFERIINKLSADNLIIVDEAELLSTKCLEFLRRINDKTQCGLVLAGMPRLLINLKGKYGDLAQLYSRCGNWCNLENSLNKDDIAKLAKTGLNLNDDELIDVLFETSQGNARRLNKIMRGAIRIAEINGCDIDERVIKTYAKTLIN